MSTKGGPVSPEGKAHPVHALLLGWVGVTPPPLLQRSPLQGQSGSAWYQPVPSLPSAG